MEWYKKDCEQQSGFIKRPQVDMCRSPSHNPPTHMVIPYGYDYKHVCPQCGNVSYVPNNSISC